MVKLTAASPAEAQQWQAALSRRPAAAAAAPSTLPPVPPQPLGAGGSPPPPPKPAPGVPAAVVAAAAGARPPAAAGGRPPIEKGKHRWEKATFKKSSKCCVCGNPIYGTQLQGVECLLCTSRAHHQCAEKARTCVPVQGQGGLDRAAAAAMLEEVAASDGEDEGDMNFMKSFAGMAKLSKAAILKIWNHYDADKNRSLDRDELRKYLQDLARCEREEVDEANVDRVMRLMDVNGDGVVQWDEFLLFYQGSRDSSFCAQFKGLELDDAKIKQLWDHYDADAGGSLDEEELMKFFRDMWRESGLKSAGSASKEFFSAFPSFWDPEVRDFHTNPVTFAEFRDTIVPLIRGTSFSPDSKRLRARAAAAS